MDRQAHEYAAAMAFAQQQQQQQQQQQFGFHPQQQFPPSVHGPPYLPPQHQQYPFPRHMQPHQLHPHPPPPPPHHLMHLQQQQQQQQHPPMPGFPPHVPQHLVPSGYQAAPYDSAPPPSDPDLQKRIDKLVEYAVKVGPEFEIMIREKEQDNPAYSFLFGGEGHNYYRYKLWLSTQPTTGPSMPPMMHPSTHMMNAQPLHQPSFPPFYDQQLHHQQQHPQSFLGHVRPDFDPGLRPFKGLAGPLPSDVAVELNNVLGSLTGTKESIKSAKAWFLQRSPFAPALAEALRDRVFAVDDSERQLHIVFLANDILFDSLTSRRSNPHDLDNEALAFKPVLGSMLARIYHNPQNKEENQSRLQKILQFWASKEVFDQETIRAFENEMIGGPIINSVLGMPKELPSSSLNISAAGSRSQWHDRPQGLLPIIADKEHLDQQISSLPIMLTPPILPPNIIPTPGSLQPSLNHQPTVPSEKLPPYPLFPPGLIPGMVRKMQIGSGVPYSPMSPLDIPTVIPPSDVPQSEILERVSKFFKDIGEVNPSDGPMKSNDDDDDNNDSYGRRTGGDTTPVRKGGACIPPPANLLRGVIDPETGTYADGSVERKPGSSSSGRLGLGATADPNEVSQYDDVYSSYRKQRSSNYHTSMSARATTTTPTSISTTSSTK